MTNHGIEIGDIYKVVPHFPDWESVGAVPIDAYDEIVWIPKGSFILVTDVFQNQRDDAGWCHALYNGRRIEIGLDLLELSIGT